MLVSVFFFLSDFSLIRLGFCGELSKTTESAPENETFRSTLDDFDWRRDSWREITPPPDPDESIEGGTIVEEVEEVEIGLELEGDDSYAESDWQTEEEYLQRKIQGQDRLFIFYLDVFQKIYIYEIIFIPGWILTRESAAALRAADYWIWQISG